MSYQGPNTEVLHQRYAQALIEFAEESNTLDKVLEDMAFFNNTLRDETSLAKVLHHPEVDKEKKRAIIDKICDKVEMCSQSVSFVKLLIAKNRLHLFHGTYLKYRDLYDIRRRRQKVFIESATALSKKQITNLKEILNKALKKNILIQESIKPSLAGGFNLKVGDKVYRLSVANRMSFIEEGLKKAIKGV